MAIDFGSLDSLDKVRQVLEQNLSAHASTEQIRFFAKEQGLECSQPVQGVIYCSAPAFGKQPLIRKKWLIRFHLKGDRLEKIDVQEGLIGP